MNVELIDNACLRIDALVLEEASLAEVISEVQGTVQGWRAEAVAVFQHRTQVVIDELEMLLPSVEALEQHGLPPSISVNGGGSVPLDGAKIREGIALYLAVVATLEADIPRPVQSLDSLLRSDPFLRPPYDK
jgi:hypothetical protein